MPLEDTQLPRTLLCGTAGAAIGDASLAHAFLPSQRPQYTQKQISKVRSHPWVAKDDPMRGFISSGTGLLPGVQPIAQQTAD